MECRLILPYPPSTNHYIASSGSRRFLTREAKSYRLVVQTIVLGQLVRFGAMRLKVQIEVFAPDNRKRDLDNLLKNIQDALENAQLYNNDNQIDDLQIIRREVRKAGEVHIWVQSID